MACGDKCGRMELEVDDYDIVYHWRDKVRTRRKLVEITTRKRVDQLDDDIEAEIQALKELSFVVGEACPDECPCKDGREPIWVSKDGNTTITKKNNDESATTIVTWRWKEWEGRCVPSPPETIGFLDGDEPRGEKV
jgi:hypothetical protein